MKKVLLVALLRKLKVNPNFSQKVKIWVGVGVLGIVMTLGFAVWAGISAIGYAANKANVLLSSPQTVTHFENLRAEVAGLGLQPLNCWGKAQRLMSVEPWLARPALDNLKNLKSACLEKATPACEGHECSPTKNDSHTLEGKAI